MACAVETYPPSAFHASQCPPQCSQDECMVISGLETAAWLRADIYDGFELSQDVNSPAVFLFGYRKAKTDCVAPEARAPAWWESELASSVHKTLKRKETALGKIELKSPQLAHRPEIVDFLSAVCRNLDISTGTRHTAVRLMDYFMDGHNVMYYRLRLVALTCLLIAG